MPLILPGFSLGRFHHFDHVTLLQVAVLAVRPGIRHVVAGVVLDDADNATGFQHVVSVPDRRFQICVVGRRVRHVVQRTHEQDHVCAAMHRIRQFAEHECADRGAVVIAPLRRATDEFVGPVLAGLEKLGAVVADALQTHREIQDPHVLLSGPCPL